MRIVVADDLPASALDVLRAEGWTIDAQSGRSADQLKLDLADADALVVRSATKVTADIIAAAPRLRAIARATDFNQYSPGVYTPSRYGLANVPVIRGELSEIYQNGQRTIYSRNSVLASFNAVEAMDIVKGPGSGRDTALRSVQNVGIEVTGIKDVTPVPHNGCRQPKRRRS